MKIGDRVYVAIGDDDTKINDFGTIIRKNNYQSLIKFEKWNDGHSGGNQYLGSQSYYFVFEHEMIPEEIYNSPLFNAMREEE